MLSTGSQLLLALLAVCALLVLTACGSGAYVVHSCHCAGGNGQKPLYLVPPHSEFVMHGALLPLPSGFKGVQTGHFSAAAVPGVPDAVEVIVRYDDLLAMRGWLRRRCELKTGADSVIATLRKEFIDFRKQLDAQKAAFAPVEFEAMTERLALLVPAPLRDTLFFAYNFGQDAQHQATIDLRPGMRVRVEGATFQAQRADVVSPAVGYVSTGQLTYTVGRGSLDPGLGECATQPDRGETFMFLDAFLRHRRAIGASQPDVSNLIFAGGAADLDSVGARYLRLLYPAVLFPGTQSTKSSTDVRDFPALLGDHSWSKLEKFAPSNSDQADSNENPSTRIVMRGRELFVPEILITINGRPFFVPIGTTLGDAVATASSMTPAEVTRRVVVRRAFGDHHERIRFATASAEILELPMLKGDEIQW